MYEYLKKKKCNKYGNRKISLDGLTFDSRFEAKKWQELCMRQRIGEITELQRQVRFPLIPTRHYGKECVRGCSYVADFVYTEKDGQSVVVDTKGFETPEYIIKKKLFLEKYVLSGEYIFIEEKEKNMKIFKKNC